MIKLFKTNIGRLRLIGLLEGISLLILLGIAVPLKYAAHDPSMVRMVGPVHGALFLLFIFNSSSVAIQQKWKAALVLRVLISCIIPLGTFFVDHYLLKPLYEKDINLHREA